MARCPACSAIVPTGPNCEVENGTCIAWAGAGTAASPFTLTPDLSAASGQILTCHSTGLQALVPNSLTRPPSALAYRGRYQTIPNNTLTSMNYVSEFYDTDTMHSNSSNNTRITFTTAGVYLVQAQLVWEDDEDGDRYLQIRKNGSSVLAKDARLREARGGFHVGHNLTILADFSGSDYVEVQVQQTSGADSNVLSTYFAASRVA